MAHGFTLQLARAIRTRRGHLGVGTSPHVDEMVGSTPPKIKPSPGEKERSFLEEGSPYLDQARPRRAADYMIYSTIISPFMTIQWPGNEQRYGYRPGLLGARK